MTNVLQYRYGRARSLLRWLFAGFCLHASLLRAQTIPIAGQPESIVRTVTDSTFIVRALNQIRERAPAAHPLSEIARVNRERALFSARATGQAAPLTFSAGLSEAPIGALDQGNLRAEVARDLRTGARRRAERSVADADVRLADVEIEAAERAASADVFRSVVTAALLRRIDNRLNAEDVLLRDAEETVRARFSTGDARYVDVLRLRTERLHVQGDRSSVAADERLSRAGLNVLSNPATRSVMIALADTLATKPVEEYWRVLLPDLDSTRAVDSLLALSSTDKRLAVDELRAAAQVDLSAAERKSQLSGYAGVQRIGQANNGPTFGPSLGFTMTLPFTASRANALMNQAFVVSLSAVRETRRVNKATISAQLTAAVEQYRAQRTRLAVFDAALLRGAGEERESALSSYRTGELSLTELLDFERAMSRAEIERLRALIDAVDALADLSRDADNTESSKHIAQSER